ncbi:MAG: alpha/beta hydrolase [Planctomycetota bacterium]|nr:alpha/beta hydrolase [Planctomycetota bacterium]
MPEIARADRVIHYTCAGFGPGVLLVPGIGSGARLFGTLPRRFARDGFTCAAINPVGLPPSSPQLSKPYDLDAAAKDVLAVAAQLPSPVSLVGTSLGGKVALLAAAQGGAAIATLVMLCSTALQTERSRRVHRMFLQLSATADPNILGECLAPFLFGASFHAARPMVVNSLIRAMQPTQETRQLMHAQALAMASFDGTMAARGCAVRTLCLAGAEDTLTLPDEVVATAALLPQARYKILERAGHSLLLESPQAYKEIVDFLRCNQ